jgi:hypothetical protein
MLDTDAVIEAGYSPVSKKQTLLKLRNSNRVQNQINYYKSVDTNTDIADKTAREKFWTSVMNNPACSDGVRLKASEYLGRAQGDFINNSKVEHTNGGTPIVVVPESSPKEWEEYWEKQNA